MARRDPLLPNAGLVARHEYRERVRSRLYLASTVILMGLALLVSLSPIAISYLDRQSVTRIAVVASDERLATAGVAVADGLLNVPPPGAGADWRKPFAIERASDPAAAEADLVSGRIDSVMLIDRTPTGRLDVVYRTDSPGDTTRTQLVSFAALSLGILDWTSTLSAGAETFQTPAFDIESVNAPTDGGRPIDRREIASRTFIGTVFILLMFISILIYGMWVATGVASEKSSRVMELMISAASPRQLLLGKVAGIGGAGLTQYLAVAVPALIVLAYQDQIATAVLGPAAATTVPTGGLTPMLLFAYGVFFILGFTLFAFVYAAVGSFVSRPDDLQTLSLPLSLVAMTGYLAALPILLGGGGSLGRLASLLPPFSPFAMLARLLVGRVEPWEVVLSLTLLVGAIVLTAVVAVRVYAAGVLLYGQRPGLRAFAAAARRAG